MSNESMKHDLTAFEAELAALQPVASSIDRDRLMFLSGQAAATGRRRSRGVLLLWQTATAASLLLAAAFAGLWAVGEKATVAQRVATAPPSHPSALIVEASPDMQQGCEYLKLRNLVLAEGIDALPSPDPIGNTQSTVPLRGLRSGDDIEQLLGG